MGKTIRKNYIMENLYTVRENLENSAKALLENELDLARSANSSAQKDVRYLITLLDQTTTIL